jgi:hypothetical protein
MIAAGPTTVVIGAFLAKGIRQLGKRYPNYSHVRRTISELGEVGAPDQRLVALGLFLPVGVALLIVAALVYSRSTPVAALALSISIGYLGAAAFPCDPGSPLSGSARQGLHNLAGGIEYIGGAFALMTIARDFGAMYQVLGFVVVGVAIALSVPAAAAVRGLIQRIAEACLFVGLAGASWAYR